MGKRNEDLHRMHDGESVPRAAVAVAAPEPLDADDQLRLAALGELGAAVRHTLLTESQGIDVWPAIEKKLKQAQMRSWRHRVRRAARPVLLAVPAVAAAVVIWLGGHGVITNGCDIELLEVQGASATVLTVPDRSGTTTVIWTTED